MILPFDHVDGSAMTREQGRHCEESKTPSQFTVINMNKMGGGGCSYATHLRQPLLDHISNLAVDFFLHSNHAPTTSETAI